MQVTGTLQREAWLRREFPPVEKVAGGVWSIPVPIPDSPLRYVVSYLIEHDSGFLMVDTGWNHPDSWRVLNAGLAECGIPMSAITAVAITHVHPDHHGLSEAVREQSGAWIGMHEREADFLTRNMNRVGADIEQMGGYMRWVGAPAEHREQIGGRRATRLSPMAMPDRMIGHGDRIDVPGLKLKAIWTPGHSPGHLCFYDETRDLMLTGDHVLPRITPNISSYERTSSALADYLRSLDSLRGIEPAEVLPAHEYRFAGLDSRLDHLIEHHSERLGEIEDVLKASDGDTSPGRTGWEVAAQVTWSRPWSQIGGFPRQAALGEVVAHLQHLQADGKVTCTDTGGVGRWALASGNPLRAGTPAHLVHTDPADDDPDAGDPAARF
jgi:glyoxylase-like metal-dependent hydrolase (beta-lactamase superfamily II)